MMVLYGQRMMRESVLTEYVKNGVKPNHVRSTIRKQMAYTLDKTAWNMPEYSNRGLICAVSFHLSWDVYGDPA